jgi:hypothetical protein
VKLDSPFEDEASDAWVARCTRRSGERLVLKVGFPHAEAEQEIDGLLFFDGERVRAWTFARLATQSGGCEANQTIAGQYWK